MKREIFNKYAQHTARLYECDTNDLFVKSKQRWRVDARHLLYYMCHVRPMRIAEIQEYMRLRGYSISHSSIIHGISRIKERMGNDVDVSRVVREMTEDV